MYPTPLLRTTPSPESERESESEDEIEYIFQHSNCPPELGDPTQKLGAGHKTKDGAGNEHGARDKECSTFLNPENNIVRFHCYHRSPIPRGLSKSPQVPLGGYPDA